MFGALLPSMFFFRAEMYCSQEQQVLVNRLPLNSYIAGMVRGCVSTCICSSIGRGIDGVLCKIPTTTVLKCMLALPDEIVSPPGGPSPALRTKSTRLRLSPRVVRCCWYSCVASKS